MFVCVYDMMHGKRGGGLLSYLTGGVNRMGDYSEVEKHDTAVDLIACIKLYTR